jgi:hypothetical protein
MSGRRPGIDEPWITDEWLLGRYPETEIRDVGCERFGRIDQPRCAVRPGAAHRPPADAPSRVWDEG